jgi:hypothetical protein
MKKQYETIFEKFMNNNTGKSGNYLALPNAMVYRAIINDGKGELKVKQNIIAIRTPSGLVLGNSSTLPLIGRSVSFGNERLNRDLTDVQEYISQKVQMIPFTVFTEAGLNIMNTLILDRGSEETLTINVNHGFDSKTQKDKILEESRHFTGASLFQIDDKKFLFDIDRNEIKYKIFNPFLVELQDTTVTTIVDAYESLKPSEVKQAEKQGKKVLRQGEWFLIPLTEKFSGVTDDGRNTWQKPLNKGFRTGELRAGNNRPNRVGMISMNEKNEIVAVSGKIEHSGREHKTLNLTGWYKPVPNTSVQSWTISGNID